VIDCRTDDVTQAAPPSVAVLVVHSGGAHARAACMARRGAAVAASGCSLRATTAEVADSPSPIVVSENAWVLATAALGR
jgi:hypothetical protein